MKKYYRASAIAIISVFFLFVVEIQPAYAGLPVIDWANLPQNIIHTIFSGSTAASTAKTLAGTILQKALNRIGSQVTLNMTQQIINWGSTGFKGNPFFVRDQSSFFKSIGDQQVESFVNEISADSTKFPYARDVAKDLITSYTTSTSQSFADKSNFTLDKIVGSNWQDFTNKDFSIGGWDGWLAYTQNDANNPIGSYLQSTQELEDRSNQATGAVQTELNQSNGFLSAKKCVQYKDDSSAGAGSSIDLNPTWYYGAANDNLQTYDVGPFNSESECQSDYGQNQNTTEACHSQSGQSTGEYLNSLSLQLGSSIQFNASDDCARYETITPGTLVSAQLSKSVTSPLDQAIAHSATGSPIVDAVSNLAAGLITKGLSDLIGNVTSNSSGDQTVQGPGDNSAYVPNSSDGTFTWNVADTIPLEGDTPGTPSQELTEAINITQAEFDILSAARDILKSFPLKTLTLDQCLPGPDYKYATRMQAEFQPESRKLDAKSDNNTNNGDQAQDQLKFLNIVMSYIISNAAENIQIKNIASAPLIVDQVKKVEEYNQDEANLENKISDKIRTLALLNGIKAGIAAHPKPADGSPDPSNVAQYKNQLAGEYVGLKDSVSREDTITDSQNTCKGYVSDLKYAFRTSSDNLNDLSKQCSFVYRTHDSTSTGAKAGDIAWAVDDSTDFIPVQDDGVASLEQKCLVERIGTDSQTREAVGKDNAQLLFCGIDGNTNPDPTTPGGIPGWQWIFSEIPYVYHTGDNGGYVYSQTTSGFGSIFGGSENPFKMDCNKFYHSSISDYLPPSI